MTQTFDDSLFAYWRPLDTIQAFNESMRQPDWLAPQQQPSLAELYPVGLQSQLLRRANVWLSD